MMTGNTLTDRQSANALARFVALWPALAAIGLGLTSVFVVGFAGAETIHDAAHDTRHSLNFPCH
jgi:cobalt transporter subunit CbtB